MAQTRPTRSSRPKRHRANLPALAFLIAALICSTITANAQLEIPDPDLRTSTFFPLPDPTLQAAELQVPGAEAAAAVIPPVIVAVPIPETPTQSQPPAPPQNGASPVSSSSSSSSSSLNATPSNLTPHSLTSNYTFPSPLPAGVAKTASGKPIPCSPKNTKLNPSTHKLISECTEQMFCLAPPGSPVNATGLGMCFPRLCRRDEFPFGYGYFGGGNGLPKIRVKGKLVNNETGVVLPPMCPRGQFCPDNGSGCRDLVPVGGRCELGRDEQCARVSLVAGAQPSPADRAVCLNLSCTAAAQSLSAPCKFENTTYLSDMSKGEAGGGQFTSFIFKHNCLAPSLFCDTSAAAKDPTGNPTCQPTRKLGKACSFDEQCEQNTCESQICSLPPQTPVNVEPWQWVAVILFIGLSMTGGIVALSILHRRQLHADYQQLQDYYLEQTSLRRAILALHASKASTKNYGTTSTLEKLKTP